MTASLVMPAGLATLPGDWPAPPPRAPQRLPDELWAELTAHEPTRQRYLGRVHRRGAESCWYWLGAISDTGHGKLRAGTRSAAGPASRVVTAHVYGWHLALGPPRPLSPGPAPVIAHRCDEPSCQNPAHWHLDDASGNLADYHRRQLAGPLADIRGPAGRARAIAAAIRAALTAGADVDAAIGLARAEGLPAGQARLF